MSEKPKIAISILNVINDATLTVRYKTESLYDLTREYFSAIYVMENGIHYIQSSGAIDTLEHNHIIRTSNG
jgi:hypothetical protein